MVVLQKASIADKVLDRIAGHRDMDISDRETVACEEGADPWGRLVVIDQCSTSVGDANVRLWL